MTTPDNPSETPSPAERRLGEHLQLLRADAPTPPARMVPSIVRAVRWQRAIRRPLLAVGTLAATVGDAIRLLFRSPTSRP